VTRDDLLQDLAYARSLAEEGRQTPLVGGSYLILFGVLLTAAYGAHWGMLTGRIPNVGIGFIWMGFGALAFLGSFLLRGRVRTLPGGASFANRADRSVWQGVAIAILAVVVGAIVRGVLNNDMTATNTIMAAGFGMYGIALYTTGSLSGQTWLQSFAWIAWLVSVALWYFLNEPWAYLIASGASVVVLIIPGLMMLQRESSTTV
jgi:hypothetical protein